VDEKAMKAFLDHAGLGVNVSINAKTKAQMWKELDNLEGYLPTSPDLSTSELDDKAQAQVDRH
jgi:hypothetical protein